jgi:hypothetical protein
MAKGFGERSSRFLNISTANYHIPRISTLRSLANPLRYSLFGETNKIHMHAECHSAFESVADLVQITICSLEGDAFHLLLCNVLPRGSI